MSNTWPLWDPSDVLSLVQFVSRKAIAPADMQPPPEAVYNQADLAEGRKVAQRLYEKVAQCGIPYAHEEWSPGTTQLIRPAAEMRQSKGTCVDLVVAYAAMCWDAQLRPMLALGGPRGARHVLVVIDLRETRNDSLPTPAEPFRVSESGKVTVDELRRLPDHVIAVDIAAATRDSGRDFAQALVQGERWLLNTNNGVELADVLYCRERQLPGSAELSAPDLDWSPPIHTRLRPPPGEFQSFPSRAEVQLRLAESSGVVVLFGESGMGKSLLAYHGKAASAAHGYGWTLTASDAKTLATELAQAEFNERNSPDDSALFDRTAYKDAALARLQQSHAPWVVVLDNADCSPEQLGALIPRPREGQTLVVTTTHPDWVETSDWAPGANVTVVRLAPLAADESGVDMPAWAEQVLVGNPQLLHTVAKAVNAGGQLGGERSVSGAQLAWETALSAVRQMEARLVASLLGWLPATAVSFEQLELLDVPHAADALAELSRVGLVSSTAGGAFQMHRLFREIARSGASDVPGELAARVLSCEPLRGLIFTEGDEMLIKAYGAALSESPLAPGSAWVGLARVLEYRGQVEESASNFEKAMEAGGLTPEAQADCLQGRARWVNQKDKPTLEEIGLAREWITSIADILDTSDPRQHLRYQRARAIDGLLLRKVADREENAADRRTLLEAVREILQDSLDKRLSIVSDLGEETDDKDRGLVNLAGTDNALGRVSEAEEAEERFDAARRAYLEAYEIRRARYGDLSIPHLVSCTAGVAMVDYNKAWRTIALTEGMDESLRDSVVGLLRDATREMSLALVQRNEFEGPADKNDSRKSIDFLIKILLLRRAVAADPNDPTSDAAREAWEKAVAGFRKEWGGL